MEEIAKSLASMGGLVIFGEMSELLQILKAVENMGGLAILAGALLYLHISALKAFREELAAERTGFLERNKAVVDALTVQTTVLSSRFDALAETLREIERRHYAGPRSSPGQQ